MTDRALYVLAGYDDRTEARLSDMQNKLYEHGFIGTHTKNIPLHITLGSFPTEREAELKALLVQAAEKTEPFEVAFNHIGLFEGAGVLFAAPDINEPLLRLKEAFGDSDGWTPHTTMIIDAADVIFEALPIIMKEFVPFRGKVTSLHLYEFFPTRYISTVYLK